MVSKVQLKYRFYFNFDFMSSNLEYVRLSKLPLSVDVLLGYIEEKDPLSWGGTITRTMEDDRGTDYLCGLKSPVQNHVEKFSRLGDIFHCNWKLNWRKTENQIWRPKEWVIF